MKYPMGHNPRMIAKQQRTATPTNTGAENLIRVFSHGFTTRKGGHGFCLYNGALAANEMGGAMGVHSGGPGQGAAFTLELPLPTVE